MNFKGLAGMLLVLRDLFLFAKVLWGLFFRRKKEDVPIMCQFSQQFFPHGGRNFASGLLVLTARA